MSDPPASDTRFEIDPRAYPKDWWYMGCMSVFAILIAAFVAITICNGFWFLTAFAGCIFLPVGLWMFFTRHAVDVFEVGPDSLHVSKRNPKNQGFHLRRGSVLELTLENHVGGPDGDVETTPTLNLFDTAAGFRRRTIIGFWLSQESKAEVLVNLTEFFTRHGFTVECRNEIAGEKARINA